MNVLKSSISITLLFAYVLGFGHSLTPHCEINCDGLEESKHEHDHDHHQHDADEKMVEEHDHVDHGDHFDEDWMDYLVCLFSDIEHHGSGCHSPHLVTQENVQWNKTVDKSADQSNISDFAVFIDYVLIGQKIATTSNRVNGPPIRFEFQEHLSSFPLRGPPIYSC